MKAAVRSRYGPPEILRIEEVPRPVPKDDELLVRVRAASVNSWDWDQLIGTPQGRLGGPFRPVNRILGADVAGLVEAVGTRVSGFRPGDAVFGDISECGWGGFAEFVCAREKYLVAKPEGMTWAQAAAIPQAGLLAFQGLRDREQVGPGRDVLINGAGGGVGTFAIQIAKARGAAVTGVDHTTKLDLMRRVGADRVIDYTRTDFMREGEHYDLILDVIARRSAFDYARALKPGGVFVGVGGRAWTLLQAAGLGPLFSRFGNRKLGLLLWRPSTVDLETMKALFAAGQVVPVIDRTYLLDEVAEALRCVGEGRVKGKIVVTVGEPNDDR